ncbi:hypothetical protein SEEC0006_08747 [Salmonella enterica subsp. enterica serovar Choleraesuis str. 0006]|nr:hypothetical protein SEEC0006_08747 [Salmonella enterica subsp. enterica serovar Choleraesuis str. 0006]
MRDFALLVHQVNPPFGGLRRKKRIAAKALRLISVDKARQTASKGEKSNPELSVPHRLLRNKFAPKYPIKTF